SAIDFTLTQQQLFRIRGRVFDPKVGQFPRQASIVVFPRDMGAVGVSSLFLGVNSYNSANGTFELRDVPPGSYWIRADAPLNPTTPDFNQRNTGQVAVDVSKDVDDLVIAFTPGFSMPGRLSIEGGAAVSSLPDSDRIRIMLSPTVPTLLSTGS